MAISKTRSRLCCAFLVISINLHSYAQIPQDKQQQLDNLLKHDCGSCHGLNRKGGLGPSLLASDMEKHTVESLATIILNGLPGTAMPPWENLLSAEDARYLAIKLKAEQDNDD